MGENLRIEEKKYCFSPVAFGRLCLRLRWVCFDCIHVWTNVACFVATDEWLSPTYAWHIRSLASQQYHWDACESNEHYYDVLWMTPAERRLKNAEKKQPLHQSKCVMAPWTNKSFCIVGFCFDFVRMAAPTTTTGNEYSNVFLLSAPLFLFRDFFPLDVSSKFRWPCGKRWIFNVSKIFFVCRKTSLFFLRFTVFSKTTNENKRRENCSALNVEVSRVHISFEF